MRLLQPDDLPRRFELYKGQDQNLVNIVKVVKEEFDASGLPAHNWEHIYRDSLNAIVIGEAENADMKIVLPAIVMHDIGFLFGASGKTHAAVGADRLQEFLTKCLVKYDERQIQAIEDCIRTHKGSMHGEAPVSLEAKVVADADLLEKFGPFGVYQYIRTWTEFNYSLEKVLQRVKTDSIQMQTETGKRLSEPGRLFVERFFRDLSESYEPYKTSL
jgi:HD superfamily phosphodiesterase